MRQAEPAHLSRASELDQAEPRRAGFHVFFFEGWGVIFIVIYKATFLASLKTFFYVKICDLLLRPVP